MERALKSKRIVFASEDERENSEKSSSAISCNKNGFSGAVDASVKRILNAVPNRMAVQIKSLLCGTNASAVEELRFRVGRPVQIIVSSGEIILPQLGRFTIADAERMLSVICGNSLYSKENELNCGFVTLEGGARVGLCGAPVVEKGAIVRFSDVSSFNIRIPREIKGCAEKSIRLLMENGRPRSSLIVSPPGVGKTTFLRDCARCFSDGVPCGRGFKVAVADERLEITGANALLDIGSRTDALSGVPKHIAIPMLIRNMSPDVIITDELAGKAEADAVAEAAKCGVAVIASAHAGSIAEVLKKTELRAVLGSGTMRAFFLKRSAEELSINPASESVTAEL